MIRGGNLSADIGQQLLEDDFVYLPDEVVAKFPRSVARPGDLIFTAWGTIEQVGIVPRESRFTRYLVSNKQLLFRPSPKIADPLFLYYFFSSEAGQAEILERRIGSSVPGFNLGGLKSIPVPLPPLPEQRAIAATLGALDDKIELNRRIGATLEGMARALYRSWFVDFDPVRAKMEGHAPAHMAPATAALFPDRLDGDGLPEGWGMGALGDIIDFNPREKLKKGAEAPYLEMKALPTSGAIPDMPYLRAVTSGTKFRVGDTLLARITPCLENGKAAMVDDLLGEPIGWGSTEFIVMRARGDVSPMLSYCLARDDEFRAEAIQTMTGSSGRQRADGKRIAEFDHVIAPAAIHRAFAEACAPMTARVFASGRESRTLATLRDALLPRLISGELRVGKAKEAIAVAL